MPRLSLGGAAAAAVLVVSIMPSAGIAAEPGATTTPATWSYEGDTGPDHWASLDPAYALCGAGREQSPVDIPADAALRSDDVVYDYGTSAVTIADNGHAVQVEVDDGSSVEIGGTTYGLLQFHFHSPSEHTVAGVPADMEMHLVHAADDGRLTVIGVLLVEGLPNPAFDPVWENLPSELGDPLTVEGAFVSLDDLLPEDRRDRSYAGSLTTPPCTEEVDWHVLAEPVEISADQLAAYRAIHDGTNRPAQPLDDRRFDAP